LEDAISNDAFQSTPSLLVRLLRAGPDGLARARRLIMEVYAAPLRIWFLGSSFFRMGWPDGQKPEEVVDGFFASRLDRKLFLADWLISRRPLRFWLITAFKHYLFEQLDAHAKSRRDRKLDPRALPKRLEDDHDPDREFQRRLAIEIVRDAMRRAREALAADGRPEHWDLAMRHIVDGRDYLALAREAGVPAKRAKVMARTALNRLKRSLREVVAWPGATPQEIDEEIRVLMEALQS
jgi:hypothetical protein